MAAPFPLQKLRSSTVAEIVVMVLATSTPIEGREVMYTGSVQFATGNYIFATRTNSLFLFNEITFSRGNLRASATIPVILQNTPWITYGGGGMVPTGGMGHSEGGHGMGGGMTGSVDIDDAHKIGIGDPIARADIELIQEGKSMPSVRLASAVKIPLADIDHGFGTGEWDYGGGLSLSKLLGGNFVFLDLTYWVLGDMPDLELQDPLSYNVSLGRSFEGGKYSLLASFSGYSKIIEEVAPLAEVGAALTRRLDLRHHISMSAEFGVTESTPDFFISFGWMIAY